MKQYRIRARSVIWCDLTLLRTASGRATNILPGEVQVSNFYDILLDY